MRDPFLEAHFRWNQQDLSHQGREGFTLSPFPEALFYCPSLLPPSSPLLRSLSSTFLSDEYRIGCSTQPPPNSRSQSISRTVVTAEELPSAGCWDMDKSAWRRGRGSFTVPSLSLLHVPVYPGCCYINDMFPLDLLLSLSICIDAI